MDLRRWWSIVSKGPRPFYATEPPGEVAPTRFVVIATSPRSGSTLLATGLRATGIAGGGEEYFNAEHVAAGHAAFGVPVPTGEERVRQILRRLRGRPHWFGIVRARPNTFAPYVEQVIRYGTSPNGVFGLKIMWADLELARQRYGFDVSGLPQPISWVHLERLDTVAQVVSFVRARQTRAFRWPADVATHPPSGTRYDDEALVHAFHVARAAHRSWREWFDAHGIEPVYLTYEQLDADYAGAVRWVLDQLGIDGGTVVDPAVRRQRDALSDEWCARFRAEHPDLVASLPTN